MNLENVAYWSADSKLDLGEVCRHVKTDILILDVLSVVSSEKKTSTVLKMVPMGGNKSDLRPFPHLYRFLQEKEKGAVYADYLEVSGLGRQLIECREQNVRILIQVRVENEVKWSMRKSILLSAQLWNSFMAVDGEFYDRPFGKEIRFDGFHFIYDNLTAHKVSNLMKRLKEMAHNEGTSLILSGSCVNSKFKSDTVESESDFTVSPIDSESFGVYGLNNFKKTLKGRMKILSKNGRLNELKNLTSRNPKNFEENYRVPFLVIAAGLVIGLIIFITIAYVYHIKLKSETEDMPKLIEE